MIPRREMRRLSVLRSNTVEMVIKVLNGCGVNSVWAFAGGLTARQRHPDRHGHPVGVVNTYVNPQGTPFQPIQDTSTSRDLS